MDAGHTSHFLEQVLQKPVDGWIGRFSNKKLLERIESIGAPVVHLDAEDMVTHAKGIWTDHLKIGEMMAEYYCKGAYTTLIFASHSGQHYEKERWFGFRNTASRFGVSSLWFRYDCMHLLTESGERIPRPRFLKDLMPTLPKPIGIACSDDNFALDYGRTLEVSQQKIPDEISLMGVGNDTMICDISNPPLSSVNLPGEQIGYEAAALLNRLMQGEAPPTHARLIPPSGIVERQSSNCVALHDQAVAHAVSIMRQDIQDPLSIPAISKRVGCTRKTLERKFQTALKKTPGEQYREIRLDHARLLLRETDLQIQEISNRCGFGKSDVFSKEFRKQTGVSPSDFRKRFSTRSLM